MLLEENALRLTNRRYTCMSDVVLFILVQEQAQIKEEIAGRPLSIVFDGTSRLGKTLAIVARFISPDWSIQQRLIRSWLLAKSLTGEEIAWVFINCWSTQYSIESGMIVAAMHDCASCNSVAMHTLKVVYPSLLDVGCFSHIRLHW